VPATIRTASRYCCRYCRRAPRRRSVVPNCAGSSDRGALPCGPCRPNPIPRRAGALPEPVERLGPRRQETPRACFRFSRLNFLSFSEVALSRACPPPAGSPPVLRRILAYSPFIYTNRRRLVPRPSPLATRHSRRARPSPLAPRAPLVPRAQGAKYPPPRLAAPRRYAVLRRVRVRFPLQTTLDAGGYEAIDLPQSQSPCPRQLICHTGTNTQAHRAPATGVASLPATDRSGRTAS